MIQFSQQYEIISKIWQSFKNGKKSEKVRIKKEDLEYAKIHFNYKRFEGYTLENFINICLFIIFENRPISKTNFLIDINESSKEDLLQSIKFKNKILNIENTLNNDISKINKINIENNSTIYKLFKENKISLLSFYSYYNEYPEKIKGRLLKKDFKDVSLLLDFFQHKEEIKWHYQ